MKWRGRDTSRNIEDRRGGGNFGGMGGAGGPGRGPRLRIPGGRAGGGVGGLVAIVILFLLAGALGIDPMQLLGGTVGDGSLTGGYGQTQTRAPTSADDPTTQFVGVVVADTETYWTEVFKQNNRSYEKPVVVLFSGQSPSGCGLASAATGPFYCPGDQNVYIDLDFYDELRTRFGAPGDFAEAYVLAHEVGHHVQNVLGILPEVNAQRARVDETTANALSVRTELQADCFAGIWANHTEREGILEPGDIDEALTAAAAVGDDALQRQAQGYVVPDSFTHGTSEQRATWFRRGYEAGRLDACDTFSARL